MAGLYIWNPFIDANVPNMLHLVLTRGDIDAVADGTPEFVRHVLDDIGVDVRSTVWEIEPFRCSYYSEYLDSDDWRDIWQVVWNMRITLASEMKEIPRNTEPWIGTNAVDDSWTPERTIADDDPIGCLVISEFASRSDALAAREAIQGDERVASFRERSNASEPEFHWGSAASKHEHLHIDLGRFDADFYRDGADYAERVMELCRNAGGRTHVDDD